MPRTLSAIISLRFLDKPSFFVACLVFLPMLDAKAEFYYASGIQNKEYAEADHDEAYCQPHPFPLALLPAMHCLGVHAEICQKHYDYERSYKNQVIKHQKAEDLGIEPYLGEKCGYCQVRAACA